VLYCLPYIYLKIILNFNLIILNPKFNKKSLVGDVDDLLFFDSIRFFKSSPALFSDAFIEALAC
jgi:hypothetical protein